ncbi:hypothetical protein AK830_g2746 [Neonectria ditissima]|uniref:Xylanolytic transcriptional activator regulatory domain-containing protein n=1 Tax=Neonectria ditissima TaxID=78410 RepID=A0A0N8H876_9HYPO|nr:hypothetical protein AK830_g2746 [Neonectria ditissima]
MFKFVSDNVGGLGSKRKLTQKSCKPCQKRHKRCVHVERSGINQPQSALPISPPQTSKPHGDLDEARREPTSVPDASTPSQLCSSEPEQQLQLPGLSEDAYLHFIGDLSPEASFRSNGGREGGGQKGSRHADVGVWLGQRPEVHKLTGTEDPHSAGQSPGPSAIQRFGLAGIQALLPYLRKECMSVLPPQHEFGFISDLYYTKIDPIFPILHGEVLEKHDTMEAVALKQCMCIIAALDPKLERHLRLPHTERLLSPIDFRGCVAAAVKQSLDLGFIQDKMVVLQICALMAFYVDKGKHSDVSTYYSSQAVHHEQTLGLHLGWPQDSAKCDKSSRIFWCVWVLDRLNAATNGRPILIHSQDMDRRIMESVPTQAPPFRLLIRITQFLDGVISKYRPHAPAELQSLHNEQETFEDLVEETESVNIGNGLLASLEMFYLAVVILRDRPKSCQGNEQRTSSSGIQWSSAAEIISIASEDLKSSITLWPVVPCAVSLATSVAYKTLRNSNIPYKRKQAYALFHSSCDVLDELGKAFLSARAMAQLATDTMQEVERVAAGRRTSIMNEKAANGQIGDDHSSNGIINNLPGDGGTGGSVAAKGQPYRAQCREEIHDSSTLDVTLFPQDVGILDDLAGDMGVFNDFDPTFDLGRIDAVFTATLNPTIPLPWEDWMENNQAMQ